MQVNLHKNARTTPTIRRELQASSEPNKVLARRYHLSPITVRKWRRRASTQDASHRPNTLQTTLSPAQECLVVELRKLLLLPLDDLLAVTREFINAAVSRSALDRCLRRHGVSRLADLIPREEAAKTPAKAFKRYEPGFVHVDVKYLPQMPEAAQRQYLFAAIDRATRWVYVEILPNKSAAHASAFLKRLLKVAPFKITKVLTDNGKEFSDRFCATGQRAPTGKHAFDQVCAANAIEHRLITPKRPQTNGMIERFNGRISEVLNTTRFRSDEHLHETISRYVALYNEHIPQRALDHSTPMDKLKAWHRAPVVSKETQKPANTEPRPTPRALSLPPSPFAFSPEPPKPRNRATPSHIAAAASKTREASGIQESRGQASNSREVSRPRIERCCTYHADPSPY